MGREIILSEGGERRGGEGREEGMGGGGRRGGEGGGKGREEGMEEGRGGEGEGRGEGRGGERGRKGGEEGREGRKGGEGEYIISYLKGAHEVLINCHHAPSVVIIPTIIRSGEQSHQLSPGKELVAILHHLMGSAYEVQVVSVQELGGYIGSKCE